MPSSYSLGKPFEAMMDEWIKSGRYNTRSEILRAGLRELHDRELLYREKLKALKAEVQKGVNSPTVEGEALEGFFAGLIAKLSINEKPS